LKEVGKKNIIPETTGFRKGNIFVQSSDSKEQADKKLGEESICSLCGSEDSFRQSRGALWKLLKRYEIKKQMIRRLEYMRTGGYSQNKQKFDKEVPNKKRS